MKRNGYTLIEVLIAAVFVLIVGVVLMSALFGVSPDSNVDKATKALYSAGYSNVKVGEFVWFGCAGSDSDSEIGHKFTATMNGRQVSGIVCCGWTFKGCTPRF